MVTYGTTAIPSDQITVRSGGTVAVSAAFERTLGLVGGMDTDEGSATPGKVTTVDSPSDAQDKFGDDSELYEQTTLAFQNGNITTLYALPVEEEEVSAESHSSQDGTLDNAPVFDPRVNGEHEITVEDTGGDDPEVEYVDAPPESAPTESDTVEIYPPTGEFYADAAPDGDYEFSYEYGDYSTSAVEEMVDTSPRIVGLLTENESVINDVVSEVNDTATDFDFMQVVSGAIVEADPDDYDDGVEERRASLLYPSRGYVDDAQEEQQRTVGAISGYLTGLALGLSSTNDQIGGFTGLVNPLGGPTDAGKLIDEQVMPLLDYPPVTIVKDMTTSTEPKFERVYAMQIIDEATEISHLVSREYVGEQKTDTEINNLGRSHRNAYIGMREATPKLLEDFSVKVRESESDPFRVNVEIGIQPVKTMDTIDVTITVGDIIRNEGAE